MKHLRARVILLACWLILFFSAERLSGPIDISNTAYVLVFAMVPIILIRPQVLKIPIWIILTSPISLLLVFKVLMGELSSSMAIVFTIVEVFALIITILLTYRMSMIINGFENSVAKFTIGRHDRMSKSTSVGQGFIYREVRRARNHQRPLALMAIAVDMESFKQTSDPMLQEVPLNMMKEYKLSGVSKTLCDQLEDCAIIVQSKDCFLVALPETKPEEVPIIIERLRKQAAEQVGVSLQIGTASLPKDSYTFEGLVDKATNEMNASNEAQSLNGLERLPVEINPVTTFK